MKLLFIVCLGFASLGLAACAGGPDDRAEAACDAIADPARRHACLRELIAADHAQDENGGIGPPSCHPASTRPDPDREEDPC